MKEKIFSHSIAAVILNDMNKYLLLISIILIVVTGFYFYQKDQNKRILTGTHYYSWFRSKEDPLLLSDKITLEQALAQEKNNQSYYEAEYDDNGSLINVKKHFMGKIEIVYP